MKELLIKKLEQLSKEAANLSQQREEAINNINKIETRLHQIVGAIQELDNILKTLQGEENEIK